MDDQHRSQEVSKSGTNEDELSRKLRDDSVILDHLRTVVQPPMQQELKPHRGGAILALGIIGLVLFFFGIIAWIMANRDLREMNAGAMDPSGRAMTQAGKTCGIIAVILTCCTVLLFLSFQPAP